MIRVKISKRFNWYTCALEIVWIKMDKLWLTGGDYAGEHPGRCDRRCVGRDGIRDLCLRRPRIVGRRAVDVISAKLIIRHRLVIVIRVTAGTGTWRRVLATAVRVPVADKRRAHVNRPPRHVMKITRKKHCSMTFTLKFVFDDDNSYMKLFVHFFHEL